MLYPLTFQPIFKERIWGGRKLEELYGKELPQNVPIGESWEISDRPGDESVVANGALKGKTFDGLLRIMRRIYLGLLTISDAAARRPYLSIVDQDFGCAGKAFVTGASAGEARAVAWWRAENGDVVYRACGTGG